jgi:hypothetical protein
MSDKRDLTRIRKRLSLKFGIDGPNKVAFTEDLSQDGLFVKTVYPSPPGSRVYIELTLPDENTVTMVGLSRWRKTVPPQVIHLVRKCGMGVKILKFVSGEEHYRLFVAKLNKKV